MQSRRPFLTRLSLLSLTAVVAACTTSTDPAPVASFNLQPKLDSIEIGDSYDNWIITLQDAAGNMLTGRTITWESSNTPVATIDPSSGTLTAVGSGQTTITARVEGLTETASIKVLVPVISIVITPDSFDLPLTTTRTISPQIIGPAGTPLSNRAILWSSQNPSVAVVSAAGLVTPVSAGTTTIHVKAGRLTKDVRVRVISEPVQSVRILPQQSVHVIRLGQTKQLSAECLNSAQEVLTGRTITWNSANPVVATVSQNGLVSGLAIGTANITATCETVNATVSAQVTPVPVSSVTITPNSLVLADGTQGQLQATARDSANNVLQLQGRQVVWSSNNVPVANVNSQGVVTATLPGTAEVTVSVDGVVSAPVTISVTPFLTAFIEPADAPRWSRQSRMASGER